MMFDYNPWTSLFLLQAIRMCKPPCVANRSRRRHEIAQADEQLCDASEPATSREPAKLAPAAPRVKLAPHPRRGWRHAFRTGQTGAEAASVAPQPEDIAA